MSNKEVQVNGHWIDLDVAVANGLDPLQRQYTVREKRGSFKEWLDNKAKEIALKNEMPVMGTMVVYHGQSEDLRGSWAMIQEVNEYNYDRADTYDLAIVQLDWDNDVEVDVIYNVSRDDFTIANKPELPEPPLADGYYVTAQTGKAYRRLSGRWYYFDTSNAWSMLDSWNDESVRNQVVLLSGI